MFALTFTVIIVAAAAVTCLACLTAHNGRLLERWMHPQGSPRRSREQTGALIVIAMNASHAGIAGALRTVGDQVGAGDPEGVSAAWDEAIEVTRQASLVIAALRPGDEGDAHAYVQFAARYLDLAIWMEQEHPRPRLLDGILVVREGWQEAVSDDNGPLWGQMNELADDAHVIAANSSARERTTHRRPLFG